MKQAPIKQVVWEQQGPWFPLVRAFKSVRNDEYFLYTSTFLLEPFTLIVSWQGLLKGQV